MNMNQPKFPLKAPAKFDPSMFLGTIWESEETDPSWSVWHGWVSTLGGAYKWQGEMEAARELCNRQGKFI